MLKDAGELSKLTSLPKYKINGVTTNTQVYNLSTHNVISFMVSGGCSWQLISRTKINKRTSAINSQEKTIMFFKFSNSIQDTFISAFVR